MRAIRNVCLALAVVLLAACGDPAPAKKVTPAQPAAPSPAVAPVASQEVAQLAAVEAALRAKHPDLVASPYKLSKVPASDLYEVVTSSAVVYTDKTASWFMSGVLYYGKGASPDGQAGIVPYTRRPAMQMLLASLSDPGHQSTSGDPSVPSSDVLNELTTGDLSGRQMFDALPMSAGFSHRIGAGTQRVAIFEDPDCPFCQMFHQDLAAAERAGKIKDLDVELITFPYVLTDVHPNGLMRARAIACAADPSAAWTKWMLATASAPMIIGPNGKSTGRRDLDKLWSVWAPINTPNTGTCARASLVDAWQAAGKQMGFLATPTMIFSDGTTFEGLISPTDLREMLAVAARNRASQPAQSGGPLASGVEVSSQAAAALRDISLEAIRDNNEPNGSAQTPQVKRP